MTTETAEEDIVIRLRAWADSFFPPTIEDVLKAADEIERLRDEIFNLKTEVHFDDQTIKSLQLINERLREALKKIVELDGYAAYGYEYHKLAILIARAALKDGE